MVVKHGSYRRGGLATRAASVGAAFSPLDVSGLELWLDADLSAITLSGSEIQTISDLSGNSRDFAKTDGNAPELDATGWSNGTAQMVFDAANSEFLEADLGVSQIGDVGVGGFTFFILLNPDSATAADFQYLFATDSGNFRVEWNNGSDRPALDLDGQRGWNAATLFTDEKLLTMNLLDGRGSNIDGYLYYNGVQEDTNNLGTNNGLMGETFLGGMSGFPIQREYPGKVKAILIYSRAFVLGGAEQTAVEDYLMSRAGL